MYVSNDPSVWTNVCSSECLVENVYVTINVIFVSVAVKNCALLIMTVLFITTIVFLEMSCFQCMSCIP